MIPVDLGRVEVREEFLNDPGEGGSRTRPVLRVLREHRHDDFPHARINVIRHSWYGLVHVREGDVDLSFTRERALTDESFVPDDPQRVNVT